MIKSRIRIVVQSRLSSSRLPAKALLPVGGYPSVVLCALRAANAGHEVIVATSVDSSDDVLADTLNMYGVTVSRGPLEDVLQRYCLASEDMDPEDFVVRLTADNMFPDGGLINDLFQGANQFSSDVICFADGLPLGTAIGAYKVKSLRLADRQATSKYDREHVTTWIGKNCEHQVIGFPDHWKLAGNSWSHLRTTMDSLSDYIRIQEVFALAENPLSASWITLSRSLMGLNKISERPILRKTVGEKKFGSLQLGTAQLGSAYGIANDVGQLNMFQAKTLLKDALDLGITEIETARDYGVAEERIGSLIPHGDASRFQVTTKLSNLDQITPQAQESEIRAAVDASVFRSCRDLRLHTLPILLMHRFEHLQKWRGAVYRRLIELQESGVISEIGVSIYDEHELEVLNNYGDINHVQIPFNVLDHRWLTKESTENIENLLKRGVVLSARSTLLQGLLLAHEDQWPVDLSIARMITEWLRRMARECGRENVQDFCFSFVRSFDWVHKVVVGVDSSQHLAENVKYFQSEPLSVAQRQRVCDSVPNFPMKLIDPRTWFQNG